MKLDNRDKMVISVGIAILVVAIIGIVYHERSYVSMQEIQKEKFRVSWVEYSDEINDEFYVGKEGIEQTYEIKLNENYAGISSLHALIEWEDNINLHGIIFKWNWTDKVDATISVPEMNFSKSYSEYGKIEASVKGSIPNDFIFEGNETALYEKLKEYEIKDVKCKTSFSITPKPVLLDKGNGIQIKILYTYYKPKIEKIS
ncbi:MAG: hypothetical protein H5T45_02140 [Thermoplasmatales archaeon]|nr:hypothetical protein [Thermoplasmatales archaeon]